MAIRGASVLAGNVDIGLEGEIEEDVDVAVLFLEEASYDPWSVLCGPWGVSCDQASCGQVSCELGSVRRKGRASVCGGGRERWRRWEELEMKTASILVQVPPDL